MNQSRIMSSNVSELNKEIQTLYGFERALLRLVKRGRITFQQQKEILEDFNSFQLGGV